MESTKFKQTQNILCNIFLYLECYNRYILFIISVIRGGNIMNELHMNLENCYGINYLNHTIKFDKSNTALIYAPNGVMKTSLAKTFKRISQGHNPEEKIYEKESSYKISCDGENINKDDIFVIEPFDETYESKNLSTLLVNEEKKKLYDEAYKEILEGKNRLIIRLNKASKIKKEDIEEQISKDFDCNNIFEAIEKIRSNLIGDERFSEIPYSKIMDPKVLALIEDESVKDKIEEYTRKYNQLIENSNLFKKGSFNPTNASTVSKTLKKEKFFTASHKIILNGKDDSVNSQEDLDRLLDEEKAAIFEDEELANISKKIIEGVASIKYFQEILEQFPDIAAELSDIDQFKKSLWISYYLAYKIEFDNLYESFIEKKEELIEIENSANEEDTMWHEVKEVFKSRFHVPFNIEIENQINAVLGTKAPNLVFSFNDENGEKIRFNRGKLDSLNFLSVGERRAMYLLFIVFEIYARIKNESNTLIIVDDISDSFDYKNKYAIIEYLKDLSKEENLTLVVLTHNFDFYRTFQSRILDTAKWDNSFIAQKEEDCIKLSSGGNKGITAPFDQWKKKYKEDDTKLIAMIPFIRNLIEYKDGIQDDDYKILTSMLHLKEDSPHLKVKDLYRIIGSTVKDPDPADKTSEDSLIIDVIFNTADSICENLNQDEISLEKKVALSIAIRVKSEKYMWNKITDCTPISKNQTNELFNRFCEEYAENELHPSKKILTQVLMMTPENIHLNSFMYEPLIDISNLHLTSLYEEVKNLH